MESLESGMGLSLFDIGMPGKYGVGGGEAAKVRTLWKTEVNDHPQSGWLDRYASLFNQTFM
jgi:hypothetical protein